MFIKYIFLLPKALFLLPGTFLHEFSHAIAATIFGNIKSFSVLPKISGNTEQYGEVVSSAKWKIMFFPIALAPLIWWGLLILAYEKHFFWISADTGLLSATNIVSIYLTWQLLWAGKLSVQDIKIAVMSLFSWSGLFTVTGILVAYFLYVSEVFS